MKKYVDFYITPFAHFQACLPFCRQLTAKAFNAGNSCIIYTENEGMAKTLDDILWQNPIDSFIPHHRQPNSSNVIEVCHPNPAQPSSIWINLRSADQAPEQPDWQRCLQIVPNQPDLLACARQQFKHYQQQGAVIKTHKIG
jgi:DNA polymerase III subunit chi